MRQPPFRLTVRRLMALVAIVALLLGGGEAVRRRRDFAFDQMRYHEVQFNDATYAARAYVDSRTYAQSADVTVQSVIGIDFAGPFVPTFTPATLGCIFSCDESPSRQARP